MVEAMRWPRGTTATCAQMEVMESGSRRYQKNWLRKERRMQAREPSVHVRKVTAGRVGSSVVGTVSATCSIGEFSLESAEVEEELATLEDVCLLCWWIRGVVISSVPVIFSTLISFLFLISTAMNKLQEIWILHEGLDSLFKGVHSIYVWEEMTLTPSMIRIKLEYWIKRSKSPRLNQEIIDKYWALAILWTKPLVLVYRFEKSPQASNLLCCKVRFRVELSIFSSHALRGLHFQTWKASKISLKFYEWAWRWW